jgi:hypothetical protein
MNTEADDDGAPKDPVRELRSDLRSLGVATDIVLPTRAAIYCRSLRRPPTLEFRARSTPAASEQHSWTGRCRRFSWTGRAWPPDGAV